MVNRPEVMCSSRDREWRNIYIYQGKIVQLAAAVGAHCLVAARASWFLSSAFNPVSTIFIGQISIRISVWALPSHTNSYLENRLRHFVKIAKFLSGQTYGISKNFGSFYPVLDMASEGTFGGPVIEVPTAVCLAVWMARDAVERNFLFHRIMQRGTMPYHYLGTPSQSAHFWV